MNRWYRIALICGILPLFSGTFIFITWLLTRWNWLMLAGYFTIITGLLLFSLGSLALYLAARKAKQQQVPYRRHNIIIACLLLVNFPAAVAMAIYVFYIMTSWEICIVNDWGKSIEQFAISDPANESKTFSDIAPGAKTCRRYSFSGEGPVNYHIKAPDFDKSDILIGYITNGMGGSATLKINVDGSLKVDESAGQ